LPLEGIDYIEGSDSLPLSMLSVCHSVTNDTLKEGLEDTTGLLVDHGRDTLDTTTTSETTDSGLCDTLDVVAQNLAVTLSTTLSEALATFAACERRVSMLMQR
jgi:ABC-type transporter Mla subunit MlaD